MIRLLIIVMFYLRTVTSTDAKISPHRKTTQNIIQNIFDLPHLYNVAKKTHNSQRSRSAIKIVQVQVVVLQNVTNVPEQEYRALIVPVNHLALVIAAILTPDGPSGVCT